jgi:hypothetical protein
MIRANENPGALAGATGAKVETNLSKNYPESETQATAFSRRIARLFGVSAPLANDLAHIDGGAH